MTVMDSGPEHIAFHLAEHCGAHVSCVLCSEQELQSFTQGKIMCGVRPSIPERDAGSQRGKNAIAGKVKMRLPGLNLWVDEVDYLTSKGFGFA